MPKLTTSKNYNNTLKVLSKSNVDEAEHSMQKAVTYLKEMLQKDGESIDADCCCHVSITLWS